MTILPPLASMPSANEGRRESASDRKLYLPYSSVRFADRDRQTTASRSFLPPAVTVHWFLVERAEPVAPYINAIQGYRTLSPIAQLRAETMVNEFFRETEFHLLRDYLREHRHEDVRTSMLTIPVSSVKPDTSTRTGTHRPFGQLEPQEDIAIYRLSDEVGYSLPFKVWGAYIDSNPFVRRISPETISVLDTEIEADEETDHK